MRSRATRSNRGQRRSTGSSGEAKDISSPLSLHGTSLSGFGLSRSLDTLHTEVNGQSNPTESPTVARQGSDHTLRVRGYSEGQDLGEAIGSGVAPFSSQAPFNKERFQQFLLQTAQDDRSSYLAKMDYLPRTTTTLMASPTGVEHRRFSATSSASGCTDRRSSTSSTGGVATVVNDEDADSATGVSHHNLSVNLRKPWSFDNLLQLHGGEDSPHIVPMFPKRVTTTAAAVPLSASSDMLDGEYLTEASLFRQEHQSDLQMTARQPPVDVDDQYDEFVDLNGDDDQEDGEGEGGSDEEVNSAASSVVRTPSHDDSQHNYQHHHQMLARDSAGANALRKAGTVSPLQTARKASTAPR